MSPEQLCEKGSESGHQKALFAWAAMARNCGFEIADDMSCYSKTGIINAQAAGKVKRPVFALEWLHSIPNGGLRDARTAALMKAEGARKGIGDVFLPYPAYRWHGLYMEMKKPSGGVQSEDQKSFESYCNTVGYLYVLCPSWLNAAHAIKEYLAYEVRKL